MNRIVKMVVVCGLVAVAGFAVYHFSGARGKVVKKNLVETIDDLLGKEKVRQQEIADSLDKANQAVEVYFDGRVKAQVYLERLTREMPPVKARYEASDRKLEETINAVEKVTKDPTVEVSLDGDTKYSQKNLDALKKLLADRTDAQTTAKKEYTEKKRTIEDAERSFKLLRDQEQDARKQVASFAARKKALDAKLEALAKQQEAAKLLRAGKASAAANFDEIEKSLSESEDRAEAEFRKAEERAAVHASEAMKASKGGDSIDDVLRAAREARGQK